jgi:hypothetical protein
MSEPAIPIKQKSTHEIIKAQLHDSVPEIAVSKTLSNQTVGGIKMFYIEPSPVMKIECRGQTIWMPITNIKAMYSK